MEWLYFTSIILLVAGYANARITSKEIEGYPNGYISDCPGSTKPAFITPKSLKHLTFTVAGRQKRYNYYEMELLDRDPDYDRRKKTMVFFGGYMDSPHFFLSPMLSKPYRDFGYNVLSVDTNYFTTMEYPVACRFSRAVGKHVAEMLAELTMLGLKPKKIELLGVSLGGQSISFTAKSYQKLTNKKISRLTALDPAGPCFRNLGPDERIDESDGDFVEIIMTNIDGFGFAGPVGHVNYYVNGGEFQVGEVIWANCGVLCSHLRAFTLWISAFYNRDKFIAMKCDSVFQARQKECYDNEPRVTNVLGPNANKTLTGIFYLSTTNSYPYYLGEKGLKRENDFLISKLEGFNVDDVIKI